MQRTIDAWARETLAGLAAIPGVRRVGLALSHGGGRQLRFVASDRPEQGGVPWCTIDAFLPVPLNHAIATGHPVLGTREDLVGSYREFVDGQPAETVALAAVPITAAGQVIGGFVLFLDTPQVPEEAQLATLGASLGERLRTAQRARARLHPSLADEPVPDDARATIALVPHDPRAVRPARDDLRRTLGDWGLAEETVETAALCLSELVTNALMHTTTDCEVRMVLDGDVLTTTVRDGGGHLPPPGSTEDPLQVHGRGLQLVAALADRWGSELDEIGTTVWFELRAEG